MMTTFRFEDCEFDPRDEILDRAHEGQLTPEQAEAEATKAGLGPLAKEPAAVDFDPIAEPYWTLAMSLAWLIWREPGKVRDYWNAYRRERLVWRYREYRLPPDGQVQAGWHLEQPEAVSMHEVWKDDAARSEEAKPRGTKLQDELWKALSSGQITATGVPFRHQSRTVIPAHEWIDLSPINYFDGYDEAVGLHTGGGPRYLTVRVARSEIQSHWPPPPHTMKAAVDCKGFLIEKMRASPTERVEKDDDLWNEAKAKFPRLSRRQYRRVKAEAVEETGAYAWARAGASRKSNRRTN